jgi:integrase
MARTIRNSSLETRTARLSLKASAKPYYCKIDEGLHLGYRKGKAAGKWVIRFYVGDQTYRVETIGVADDTIDADGSIVRTFAQAQAEARKLFIDQSRKAAGLDVKSGPYTVKDCMDDYLTWFETNRKSARDARSRSDALIIPTLGDKDCAKLTVKMLRDWRDGIAKAQPRIRSKKGKQNFRDTSNEDPEEVQRKRRASANRVLTILKAALNRAWRDDRKIASDDAWRSLQPFGQADAARIRYLQIAEARRLINACDPDFRNLVKAALQTGCRYSELAGLQVQDFNPDTGTLHVRTSKSGKGRHVVLTEEGIALFKGLAAGRAGDARLLPKADGGKWLPNHQSRPMAEACKNGQITPAAGFHALRHTYASLSIMNGAPLMVVARNLGHVDTRMVEKHYGHMSSTYVADAIRAAAPRFDVGEQSNVARLEAVK